MTLATKLDAWLGRGEDDVIHSLDGDNDGGHLMRTRAATSWAGARRHAGRMLVRRSAERCHSDILAGALARCRNLLRRAPRRSLSGSRA
jgi:hypothetical protein